LVNAGLIPIRLDLSPDLRVLLFLVGMALMTGIGFGIYPALRVSRVAPSLSLQYAGRADGPGGRQRFSRGLVTVQIAVSLLLLVGAGLLVESFRNLHGIAWGFRPDHVIVFDLQHNPSSREPAALARVVADIERGVSELPGVESASVSWILLFSTWDQRTALHIPGYVAPLEDRGRFAFIGDKSDAAMVRYNPVSPKYFETVGMRLMAGRSLDVSDRLGAPLVAVVNESMARRYFGNDRAVGRTFTTASEPDRPVQIVGVVQDAKYNNLREDTMPMYYAPIAQSPRELRGLEVRTREPLSTMVGPVRQAIADATKDVMIQRAATLMDHVDRSVGAERLMMQLSSFFAVVASLLACVGLYGVLAYQLARRTGEIGIRMALGATRHRIMRLMLGETAFQLVIGILFGLALAFGTNRLLSSFLYGLSPYDPSTIAIAVALFVGSAGLAAYFPSRRAASIDPNVALRSE
jgi:predicted permease